MLQDCNKILHIQPDIVGHLLEKAMKMKEEEEDNNSESDYNMFLLTDSDHDNVATNPSYEVVS